MAIIWGAWETAPSGGGTSGMRIGLDASWSTVTNTSTTVTLTVDIWTENYLTYLGDTQTIDFSGSAGAGWGTYSYTNSSGTNPVKRVTKTYTYTYAAGNYGASPGAVNVTAVVGGAFDGTSADVSVNYGIPARPFGIPTAPSGQVGTRNSDTQATVTWTRNATTPKPYTSQTVQMRTYTGSTWSAWSTVATVSGTATSYVKTGLSANHAYQFAIRANNTVGSSGFVYTNNVYMTPAAPSNVVSTINAAGTQITTTWKNNAYLYTGDTQTIQRSVNGAAFANVVTGLAYTATSWTDPAPGAGSNQYRVAVVGTSVTSAYGTGNTVTTVVPPLAPTLLSPNGATVDLAQDLTLTWQHNPGTDNAPQSRYTIETSSNGGSTWTTLTGANDVASTSSMHVVPAGTLTNGTTYLWRVKTRGASTAAYGPVSSSATFTGSAAPVATLTAPTATLSVLPFTVLWTYNQDQSSPQVAWQAQLLASDGVTVLQDNSGEDNATGTTFTYPVVNAATYTFKVRVKSAAGVWSNWSTGTTTISLLPPAAATLTATFDHPTGTTILSVAPVAPVPGTTLPVDTVTIDRRIDGGEWVTLYTGLWVPNDVLDPLPSITGLNEYRVTSVSSSPSYYVNGIVSVLPPDPISAGPDHQWVFLNYGDTFDKVLRFRGEPEIKPVTGRRKAQQSFLGRKRPVLLLGENRTREVSVAGTLIFDQGGQHPDAFLWCSPPSDWEEAGLEAEVVCLRDFMGRRIFGSLSDVSAYAVHPSRGEVSFAVTEVDYTERYGLFEDEAIYENLLDDESASFEGGTVGLWTNTYTGAPAATTITSDATRAVDGTRSLKIVMPTAAAGAGAALALDCDPTLEYVARARVFVPAATPAVRFGDPQGNTGSVDSTVKDTWQTLTVTWTGKTAVNLTVRSTAATTSGQAAWADTFHVYTR